jgi:hypothetical protein
MRLERRKKMVDARFVDQARRDLTALLAAHPELEFDDVLCTDMIEGATNALELLDEANPGRSKTPCFLAEALMLRLNASKSAKRAFPSLPLLRKYMMQLMDSAGLKKVERPAATISIAAGRSKGCHNRRGCLARGLHADQKRTRQNPHSQPPSQGRLHSGSYPIQL